MGGQPSLCPAKLANTTDRCAWYSVGRWKLALEGEMGEILVGTASWADPSLIKTKRFYPKDASKPEPMLRYYATRFPMVEVDSSSHALPSSTNAQKWAERTPNDFTFNIEAYRLLTGHQTPRVALPKDIQDALALHFVEKKNLYYKDTPLEIRDEIWRRYELGIRPLRDAGNPLHAAPASKPCVERRSNGGEAPAIDPPQRERFRT